MAANTASGQGSTKPKKKVRASKGNRVERFRGWSPEHKQAVLEKLGISLDDFRAYGGGKKQRVLNRAFDGGGGGGNGSGGGGNPSQPAFDRNDPAAFTGPLSYNQAVKQGQNSANLQYGPQEQILNQQASNIPSWFDQYRASLTAAQQQAQTMNQPLLDQSAQRATNSGQTVLKDVDPNSEAAQNDVLAAAARKSMENLFTGLLGANQQATTNYLSGRSEVANQAQQQATTDNTTARKSLAADKGKYVSDYVGNQREAERKYGLESAAFNLDQYQAQTSAADDAADNARQRRQDRQARKPKPPSAKDLAMYDVNKNGKLDPGEAVKRNKAGGTKTKAPTAGQAKITGQIRRGVELVREKDNGLPQYWKESYQRLVRNDGLDPIIARAIINGARTGRVGSKTAQALLDEYGISKVTIHGSPKRKKAVGIKRPPNAGSSYGNRPT